METVRIRDGKTSDPGAGINIPDPQQCKKGYFFIFFSYNLSAGTVSSVLKIKFFANILFCYHYFSPLNTFLRKGKDPEPDPDPQQYQVCLIDQLSRHQ
jgi:hypothetical protein